MTIFTILLFAVLLGTLIEDAIREANDLATLYRDYEAGTL